MEEDVSPVKRKVGNPGKKSTKTVVHERVRQVSDLYLNGKTRSQIIQYATDQGWDLTERQIDSYIEKANSLIREINKATIEETRAKILNGLWELKQKALLLGEASTARQCLMDIAKINQLEKHVFVIEKQRDLEELTDEELDEHFGACPQKEDS